MFISDTDTGDNPLLHPTMSEPSLILKRHKSNKSHSESEPQLQLMNMVNRRSMDSEASSHAEGMNDPKPILCREDCASSVACSGGGEIPDQLNKESHWSGKTRIPKNDLVNSGGSNVQLPVTKETTLAFKSSTIDSLNEDAESTLVAGGLDLTDVSNKNVELMSSNDQSNNECDGEKPQDGQVSVTGVENLNPLH